ncbi:MAG TPA: NF038122 family metalloprotease [Armatimonadaceae bacterium]|nr:NF038122 family metalloprotease [Armatimonadaceae bacterium]
MRKNLRQTLVLTAAASALAFSLGAPARALNFNFSYGSGITEGDAADLGFKQAATLWSSLLTDNITVNIEIDLQALGAGVLGQAGSAVGSVSYANIRSALVADAISADDLTATSNLQTGPLNIYMNRTATSPGNTPYLDNNNSFNNNNLSANTANLKALGFNVGSGLDAAITFSSNFAFDFDRSNGIGAGQFDFVGIAAHEIGHALGFVSAADYFDESPGLNENGTFDGASILDLFRFSTESVAAGGLRTIDITADSRNKFFSLDGGATPLTPTARFSTGAFNGDGSQASHWKDNLGSGIMDPTAASGELLLISELDLRALDVMGYNRIVALPEPSTFALMGLGGMLLGGVAVRRGRNRRSN